MDSTEESQEVLAFESLAKAQEAFSAEQTKSAELLVSNAELTEKLTKAETDIESLSNEVEELNERNKALGEDLIAAKAEAAKEVAADVASAAIDPVEDEPEPEPAKSKTEIYRSLEGAERTKFFADHKEAILKGA